MGNFLGYETLSTSGKKGYSMILETTLDAQGNLESAKIIPVLMNSQGIPYIDNNFKTVGLLRYLIKQDFPNTPIEINQQGQIIVKTGE